MTDRHLSDVLRAIIDILPDDEASLRARLGSIREGSLYGAPETQTARWHAAATILGDRVGELLTQTRESGSPFPEWPEKTRRLFAGIDPIPAEVSHA